ncbi:hypothetical protein PBI_MOSMORIS_85 [Mycobacterium phage MosMoris]|uniref:Uncharacterized protein n=2 Tax=Marvinvirus mosmoris TaxID=1982093 RepID=A0A023ZX35_9CAUD|nr:hypothetical protein FH33_gp085 [Mycobacterium phage MosMoris]AHY84159.1 hypothetical protein PBI_MOSMORIS_85 [Mycobacterium phage MosMoris]ANM46310.1 hypothetical protein SEA_GATTACA_88 [Mycobacterium phage Gattaca]
MPMKLDSQTGWVVKKSPVTGRWEARNWFFKSAAKVQEFATAREAWDFVVASTYGRHDLHRIDLGRWDAAYLLVPMRYVMGLEEWSLTRLGWEAALGLPEDHLGPVPRDGAEAGGGTR